MGAYIYETHLHTSQASKCGRASGCEYVDYFISRGYSGVIVTDHFLSGNTAVPQDLPWKERIDLYAKGYEDAKRASAGTGFNVMFGVEHNFEGDEFLIYGLGKEWLIENSSIMEMGRRQLHDHVRSEGGIMVQAHPFRERDYLPNIKLTDDICDGVEVYNAENSDNMNALAFEYAKKLGVPMTSGSDIHRLHDRKLGGMLFEQEILSVEEYRDAVIKGEGTPVVFDNGKFIRVSDLEEMTVPSAPPSVKVIHF